MRLNNLKSWLDWLASQPTVAMDLSLERVQAAFVKLNILKSRSVVITVAGTNGKGSTVAGLEAIYIAAGYRVGVFSTPFLFSYNEQVRLQGEAVCDTKLCDTFQILTDFLVVEDIFITPFEFLTLAAFLIFQQAKLDVWILEVGLGGRFDAVNVIDADISVITTIALDHQEWLGNSREQIALEKAGILRSNKPAVCGDFDPPLSLLNYANEYNIPLFCQGLHFDFNQEIDCWNWWSAENRLEFLPHPLLALQNMSTVLMTVKLMQQKLPVMPDKIKEALKKVALPGRIQVKMRNNIKHIFDVSHNPAAVAHLVEFLKRQITGKIVAVFSMLADKDILSSILTIKSLITHWHIAPIQHVRGASLTLLIDTFQKANILLLDTHETIVLAYQAANEMAKPGDCLLIFGSFHTISACEFYFNDL